MARSCRLLDEGAVRIGGAEIDVDAAYLVAREGEELRVAEFLAVAGEAPVAHEGLVALDEDLFQAVALDALAVRPAPLEIGLFVDPVVIRAGEGEILGEQPLDQLAILLSIRRKAFADDV